MKEYTQEVKPLNRVAQRSTLNQTKGFVDNRNNYSFLGNLQKNIQLKLIPHLKLSNQEKIKSDSVIQCLKIREGFDSYRNGAPVTKEIIRSYFYEYEIPLMIERVEQYCPKDKFRRKVAGTYETYKRLFSLEAPVRNPNWRNVVRFLNLLVNHINDALYESPHAPSGYAKEDSGNWYTVQAGLLAANAAVDPALGTTNPRRAGAPVIHTIPWSSVKDKFPIALVRLLRDIFGSWRSGGVMDERIGTDEPDTLTSKTAGSLRSWHMNTAGTLPAESLAATPANAAPLEAHYQAHSHTMNHLGVAPPGPIGFAEYTGTGILDDAHHSKIILDYKRGDMYLTLTHYQYWTNAGVLQGQADGDNNPWFKIDMNH